MNLLQHLNIDANEYELEQLRNRLCQFGLCPNDWSIKKVRANQYIIENREDADFYFTGHTQTKGNKKIWSRIALKNI